MGVLKALETLGYMFYVVSPNRTSFETIAEVPEYTVQVVPFFAVLVWLELIVMTIKKNKAIRINDSVGSISQGMLAEITRIIVHSWHISLYIYVYNNWRLVTLPWHSLWTWWIAFLAVDFLNYWGHRASHEVNILWAVHQVHHSSEDYNLSTALRQSVLQRYVISFFYLPMALAVPPSAYLVHASFNLLYQFWIHTEAIKSMGPLEYILNTASHHRVHHGRNRYCIDKNYGGTLIIWDRLFGTFASEKEEVVYGLTHPINTFQPFYIQMCHFLYIWKLFWATDGWRDKLFVILKGPGWSPGKPRLGCIEDIPDVHKPVEVYDPYVPKWCKLYSYWHFLIIALIYVEIARGKHGIPPLILYGAIAYLVVSLSIIGMLLEGRLYASYLELLRCICYLGVDYYFLPCTSISLISPLQQTSITGLIRLTFICSAAFWLRYCAENIDIRLPFPKNPILKKLK